MTVPSLCRFCKTPLRTIFCDLGETPLANSFIEPGQTGQEQHYPLVTRICSACMLVQASDSLPPDAIFSDYPYFSSMSDSWVEHARRFAANITTRLQLDCHSLVVEVASNDGYLLQHFQSAGISVLGIEPAVNVAQVALAKHIPTLTVFLGLETARTLVARYGAANLVVANNVLAHVPDLRDFLSGIRVLLTPEGTATFEFPHVLQLITHVQFDTIYHEHFSYLSLFAVEQLLAAAGLKAVDVEQLPTHGGSLRVYAVHASNRAAPSPRVISLRTVEQTARLDSLSGYDGFAEKIAGVKAGFLAFLAGARAHGKSVAAYGAAAKGNTFLNVCGTTSADIVCAFDRATAKQGKLLPGSHIPVLPPDQLAVIRPDYLLILPWNIADEIMRQNQVIANWNGAFVTAIPTLRITPAGVNG